jgi:N-glycosylase/DNA lyase
MESLIGKVNDLKNSEVSSVVADRCNEFVLKRNNKDDVFSELCFCLLTANFQAEKSIVIQEKLERDFFDLSEEELALKLKTEGHRFWPQRAERIVLARDCINELFEMLGGNEFEVRDWLVKNIKGLGMKESSHFLRNIGFFDVAIIDFHIIDLLVREGVVGRPKTLSEKVYLEVEEILRGLGKMVDLNLAELDLYLWCIETGRVLK